MPSTWSQISYFPTLVPTLMSWSSFITSLNQKAIQKMAHIDYCWWFEIKNEGPLVTYSDHSTYLSFFFFFFFMSLAGVWTQGLMLTRKTSCHLSRSTSSLLWWILSRYGLSNYLPGADFELWSSWALPLENLRLQGWATGSQAILCLLKNTVNRLLRRGLGKEYENGWEQTITHFFSFVCLRWGLLGMGGSHL
jgi:hypothetical protein